MYKVFLYQDANKDIEFYRNLDPNDRNSAKQIDTALDTLTWFNVHVDAVLKRVGGAYFITETSVKQYV